eukprot:CAMPEP_0184693308 /NCGR_PEP_ID=MMETSP0313-20130426/1558_1 /TAXON_ID=2792 /ORGANISM="Porphyridium aerugineum, Strain SAG 1380-2" /LENGTH=496 /DNA_ID=CAMNT_0027151353 /DNA_START=54 /DNA_END=1544 /DNA_ORIENTATION=+
MDRPALGFTPSVLPVTGQTIFISASSFQGYKLSSRSVPTARVRFVMSTSPASSSSSASAAAAAPASSRPMEKLRFLTADKALEIQQKIGTPCYCYDLATLEKQAKNMLAFPNAYGLTVRYAMKASPNAAILKVFHKLGLHIDASSGYEVKRAIHAGFEPERISLSTQELPANFAELIDMGVKINACSLSQLSRIGEKRPGAKVGIRVNPGMGSGGTGKTNVGGPSSSFGIWYELLPQAKEIVAKHKLNVVRVHTHIGSGSDPAVWTKVSGSSIALCEQFPSVDTLNLGGGYKVARAIGEKGTDPQVIGQPVKQAFEEFAAKTGRKLKLEIEPGTYLLANSASLVATVQDIVTTGKSGHEFIKLDAGMTEVLRPSLYGANHPVIIIPKDKANSGQTSNYVVVGHCCESGDLITCAPGEPETLDDRPMNKAHIGDVCVVEGVGAYCAGMSSKNYNSFPEAPEAMLDKQGNVILIRKKQEPEQIWQNEVALSSNVLQSL